MTELVTQLKNTHVKRTTYQGRGPIWEAIWMAEDNEESGYSAYNLHTLLRAVLTMQEEKK